MPINLKTFIVMGAFFPIIFSLALLLAQPYESAGITTFETKSDPMNLVIIASVVAIGTVIALVVPPILKDKEWFRYIFIGLSVTSIKDSINILLYPYLPNFYNIIISTFLIVIMAILLIGKPEWYIIDIVGVFLGASITASLGMSLSVSLSIVLLIGFLIYDAIAVYKTKHMIQLAQNVLKMRLPVIMIVPFSLPYEFVADLPSMSENKAYVMGLGDMVFPGILLVSAQANIQNPIITLSIVLGILAGYVCVSYFVSKGKTQAGLPFLCTGAILGFVISSFIVYGRLAL